MAAAVLPLGALMAGFAGGAVVVGMGTEVVVLSMLAAATVAGGVAVRHGGSWEDIQRATGQRLASVLPAILILLAIGMLIGSWVLSGTIPLLISWGIQLVEPRFFILTAFLVTAVMSLATGTSWGSAGTLGVALMGAATALEVPLGATAGAIVSGAYFGDKMSPLSDSTNICAIGAGANLYAHIRHMLFTALPSFGAAALVYGLAGGAAEATISLPASAAELLAEMRVVFELEPWALLPVVVVVLGIAFRQPPALALAASSVAALGVGVWGQGFRIRDAVQAIVSGFEPHMVASLGHDPAALSPAFLRLLERGGLNSMAGTLIVILSAFLLAGGLDTSGALDRIVRALLGAVSSAFGLISATLAAGTMTISMTSHGGVTALIVGGLFRDAYRQRKLAPENLSRSLEDSVTIIEPLMPWTVSAIFMATTLDVATVVYAPWAVFCYCGPLFSLLVALAYPWTGVGLKPVSAAKSQATTPQSKVRAEGSLGR
ncbi:MAG: Na+/H+ antiporter NhaC [Deltaproteobacteria bacterium]|nr:Na+/H+ antiporter NhaC [Deltaproteobacteria bacterium]